MANGESLGASYRLGELIGSGAAGQVWLATDIRTDEQVAAKILRPEHASDPNLVERFVRERSLLIGLRHPNVVAVRDLVVEGDRLAIVMDYIGGGSMRDVLTTYRNLPAQVATGLVAEVLEGLAAAHNRNISHRDIKPDNVLLAEDWLTGRTDGAKVTDFGIARLVSEGPRTSTGLLGTPEYMAPELITTGVAGPAGDVYGAGVLLYELLAGRTPFAGPGTDFTVAYRHVTSKVPQLDLPDPLWSMLHRLLDKDPRHRPSAAEAAAELHRLSPTLGDVAELAPPPAPAEFTPSDRPATAVRGIETPTEDASNATGSIHGSVRIPDLGVPGQATSYRPLPQVPVAQSSASEDDDEKPAPTVWWKRPWAIGSAAVLLAAIIVVSVVVINNRPHKKVAAPPPTPAAYQASQSDQPLPTGLGISRKAQYDNSSQTIQLTITYSAQKAPLKGPFLEIIPGLTKQATCPTVSWDEQTQRQNLPSVTGITARCGWNISGVDIAASETTDVSVAVHQKITSQEQLQEWLDKAAAATSAAVADSQVSGVAYPVQRLQDIEITTPPRIVSQTTISVTLVPVWPSGADPVDPLYRSPSSAGNPSQMLVAIAGGVKNVRFIDGCSGALAVSSNGLTVTALSQAQDCTINAQVGNFTNLSSQQFAIVTRGG